MLKVSGLSVNYGFVKALKDVTVEVESGSIVAVLGANGAGKSTVLRSISRLVPVEAGSIEFLGKDITRMTPEEAVRLGIIHCPERRRVFPEFTVEENLRVGSYRLRLGRGDLGAAYDRVYAHFPVLKQRRGQIAGTLSGGEQQMLAMGRSLMGSPRLLLLDEPSLGLAPLIVKEIFRIIADVRRQGVTVVLVEQNARYALGIADRVYVLETGKVALFGTSAELLRNQTVRDAYLGGGRSDQTSV